MKRLSLRFGIAACTLIAATDGAPANDYSRIDCESKRFLIALMGDINATPAMKAVGSSIVDISDASTVSSEPTKAVCRVTLSASDLTKADATVSIFDNSLGQPIIEITPIDLAPVGPTKGHRKHR
jgi:hypothetical protein